MQSGCLRNQSPTASSTEVPAIVLGTGETALGTIRSLHRSGIKPIHRARCGDVASWSRYHVQLEHWPWQVLEAADLAQWLGSLDILRAVLMPCSDPWVQSVSRLGADCEGRFPTWTCDPSAIDTLVDKNLFRQAIEDLGLPRPASHHLAKEPDHWNIPDTAFRNAFLKPNDSPSFLGRFGVKGMHVKDRAEAIEKCQTVWREGLSVLLQEYVPGPPGNHYFIDGFRPKDGSDTHYLARQRIRMYPSDFGNSTCMRTVDLAGVEPAVESLEKLFIGIGFHGIFSAEFKRDERDGQFRILEVNCRPWWYVDFADRCGLKVCQLAYEESLGISSQLKTRYRANRICTYPSKDLMARKSDGQPYLSALLVTMVVSARSIQPVFSWLDPLPSASALIRRLYGGVRKRLLARKAGNPA